MRFNDFTLSSDAPRLSKQEAREHLQQLCEQMPAGHIRDILHNERPAMLKAIDQDFGFTDFSRHVENVRREETELAAIKQRVELARQALAAAERNVKKAEQRLSDIEDTRRELARLLKDV